MHRLWLGKIYPWAGEYRHVNMEKDGFPFAAANQVSRLMRELERGALRQFTRCRSDDAGEQAHALALAAPPDEGVTAACLNGAWIPSMADEVDTEVSTMRRRTTGSRR